MTRNRILRTAKLAALLLTLGGLFGCAILGRRHVDQPISEEQVAALKTGMEKREVTALMGAPQEILFNNKEHDPLREHAYIYEYKVDAGTAIFLLLVNFGNFESQRDRVVVFFDENGKVANIGKSLYSDEANYGFPFGR